MSEESNGATARYLADVEKAMFGMDKKTKNGIISELRSHISDAIADGQSPENVIADLEDPKQIAKRYKDVYGYGLHFNLIFIALGVLLAITAVPRFPYVGEEPVFSGLFALAIIVVGLAGYLGGKNIGLAAGIAAFAARVISFFLVQSMSADEIITRTDDQIAMILASVILIVAGWGMGKAKEKWQPDEDEF